MDGSPEPALNDERANVALRSPRTAFASAIIASSIALLVLMAATLFTGAPDQLGIAMLMCFALTLPWTTIGFWNAAIGLSLMSFSRNPAQRVAPFLRNPRPDDHISSSTALLICIRNEDTARLARNLAWMLDGLVTTGEARWFHLYILRDSNRPAVAAAEERM